MEIRHIPHTKCPIYRVPEHMTENTCVMDFHHRHVLQHVPRNETLILLLNTALTDTLAHPVCTSACLSGEDRREVIARSSCCFGVNQIVFFFLSFFFYSSSSLGSLIIKAATDRRRYSCAAPGVYEMGGAYGVRDTGFTASNGRQEAGNSPPPPTPRPLYHF